MTLKFTPSAGSALQGLTQPSLQLRRLRQLLGPLLLVGGVGAAWVGVQAEARGAFGVVLLWAAACLACGSLLGFLFGIPRAGLANGKEGGKAGSGKDGRDGEGDDTPRNRPNTNLEEVSDWLTKILVGLTLVNLGELRTQLHGLAASAAAGLRHPAGEFEKSAALALIVFFTTMGFLAGYLYTRLVLQKLITDADKDAFGTTVDEELADTTAAAPTEDGQPVRPSDQERMAARRILDVAPVNDPSAALAPIRERARKYEELRRRLPFSPERTQRMGQIAAELRKLALVAKPHLPQLMASASPGERLAATSSLQMSFDPSAIEWLAERIHEDAAFIGYQAASVLMSRMDVAGPPERRRIVAAVQAALAKGVEPETARDRLVAALLAKGEEAAAAADRSAAAPAQPG
jgi:hypothetical protein